MNKVYLARCVKINIEDSTMPQYKNKKIRKLSLDFCKGVNKDAAKRILILPKIILEGLNLWPGKENVAIKFINYACFINLVVTEITHVLYIRDITTDVSKVAAACTTVSSTLQTACKLMTLRYHKSTFNNILSKIWDEFWPVELASKETQKKIKSSMLWIKTVCVFYLCLALFSVTQFMALPLIIGNEMLPLPSKFPFDDKKVGYFEMLYVWQYFSNFIVVTLLSGHDFFFSAITMNVVAQFQILQDVLKSIYLPRSEIRRLRIYEQFGILRIRNGKTLESQLFSKCINHHISLLLICKQLEKSLSFIIFIQFFVSSMAICVSTLVLTTNPTEMGNMFTYAVAHLIQLFILCSTGNELIHESLLVADAAVECGYQEKFDNDIRHGLLMIVQRSQREVKLTALGFTELSYRSFIMLLRISFSFYTMLNSLN